MPITPITKPKKKVKTCKCGKPRKLGSSLCNACYRAKKAEQDKKYREKNREKLKIKDHLSYISGIERKCLECSKIFKRPKYKKSKFCSRKCHRDNWIRTGKRKTINNPAWKNGNHSSTYRKIFLEDCEKKGIDLKTEGCQICGITTALAYDIHHIVFRSEMPKHEKTNDPINLIYLCRSCHNKLHRKKRESRKELVIKRNLEKVFNKKLI